jgi:hypothetical protein
MGSVLDKNNRRQGVPMEEKLDEIGASIEKRSNRIFDTIKCTVRIGAGISLHRNETSEIATM